ncbi:MAG: exodeoxyribonuclease VII small subunit [Acidimicrobiales bacterium]|jgi:exodeoxyribonuclease VII small subunit|nr:exodeoxyribonuclease VII small subunit [Actinomycetota bacterium]MBT5206541.1 exodeoxyribonuclease VII small subunit [Acidimicrobiaceae bacterium]MBT6092532.1 exodeoxyribonuclease VII small subunit [Acidimicrobiaceae bacterium]MDG2161486.1 exodeoxyribonuclease VII small subunit [Acidimicrobiales bacterium]|tara:strand:- start:225 stop:458 length:234 start_codon:yes stop_codon:yes gene_type:complete
MSDEHQEAGVLPGYADSLDELQEILASLESEATDVDQLVERVQRADVLIRHCRSRLEDARFRVDQVVASLGPDPDGS